MTFELQRELGEWARATFPHGTSESILAHLKEEIGELEAAIQPARSPRGYRTRRASSERYDAIGEEIADCIILLLHLAHRHGIIAEAEVRKKFERNKRRTWESDDNGRGYRKHVE